MLHRLYDASAEDMRYGIGTVDLGTCPPAPIIMIQYGNWSREKLEVIRDSFRSGITLSSSERKSGVHHIHLATREVLTFEHAEGEHTSVLRAPAWDAHLASVEGSAFRVFDECRRQRGGFLLVTQAGGWEFMTAVDGMRDRAIVGTMLPRAIAKAPPMANIKKLDGKP
jgi:hypothetical protein